MKTRETPNCFVTSEEAGLIAHALQDKAKCDLNAALAANRAGLKRLAETFESQAVRATALAEKFEKLI